MTIIIKYTARIAEEHVFGDHSKTELKDIRCEVKHEIDSETLTTKALTYTPLVVLNEEQDYMREFRAQTN